MYKKDRMIDNSKVTITDADIIKLENKFTTKDEFQKLVLEIKDMRNDFTTRFDEIMGELKKNQRRTNCSSLPNFGCKRTN